MNTEEQPTCGKGLAENSVLPMMLGNLIAAMAENLEAHKKALDLADPNSRVEYSAYESLIGELQQIAAQLQATANEMLGYRDLPMGKHDEIAMRRPDVRTVFEKFVVQKQEVWTLLQQTAERDAQLLEMMRTHDR